MFQLDATTGATAGVAEMLLQSHSRTCPVHLLPALPPRWAGGVSAQSRSNLLHASRTR